MPQGDSLELPIGIAPEDAKKITLAEPAKLKLPDELVLEQFRDWYRTDNEARKHIVTVWDAAWDLYNGNYDWTGKEDWQAKINIPKVRGVVDTAAGSFKRALIRMKRFYHIESETRLGIEKGFYSMTLLDYWLEQMKFVEEFTTGLKAGLITSTLVYKIWWDWVTTAEPRWEDKLVKETVTQFGIKVGEQLVPTRVVTREPQTVGVLRIKAVDPYNMWIGPKDTRRIERATVNYSYLEAMAKKGVYDSEAVHQLIVRGEREIDKQKEAQRRNENTSVPQSRFEREIDVFHYWGDLYGDDGSVVARNILYTVGGATHDVVLRKPQENPFFHGKDPYVIGTPYVVPFSTYNRGIVQDIAGIAKMITELSALIIDGAQFDAMSAFEADTDLLADPKNGLKKGIYPGVVVATKGYENPSNKQVVRPITTGKIPQLALQVRQMLDQEQQLSSSVTNALRGAQIGAETLGEFNSIVSSANANLDDAARTVEETCVDDILAKSMATIYQYNEDYTLPRLTENYPQTSMQIVDMTPEERYATMIGGYAFRARGVSIMMDKAQDLKQIDTFVKLVSAIPGVMSRINVDELLENIIVGIGWNPSRILLQQGNQPVVPAAVMGGQTQPQLGPSGMPMQPGQGPQNPNLTPAQMVAGQQGAQMGGARNNPMATPHA